MDSQPSCRCLKFQLHTSELCGATHLISWWQYLLHKAVVKEKHFNTCNILRTAPAINEWLIVGCSYCAVMYSKGWWGQFPLLWNTQSLLECCTDFANWRKQSSIPLKYEFLFILYHSPPEFKLWETHRALSLRRPPTTCEVAQSSIPRPMDRFHVSINPYLT